MNRQPQHLRLCYEIHRLANKLENAAATLMLYDDYGERFQETRDRIVVMKDELHAIELRMTRVLELGTRKAAKT